MPDIEKQWEKENLKFEAVYTGYLGSTKQIDYVESIMKTSTLPGALKIVDPAMADGGKLYPTFDMEYVEAMKKLVFDADITLPNITEACFLTGMEYKEEYDEAYIDELLQKMTDAGAKTVVLTGVSFAKGKTGVMVLDNGKKEYYEHDKIAKGCHGTGDVYASAFVGALMEGKSAYEAAKIAADYTVMCIQYTQGDPDHWYGVKFEPLLGDLIQMIK